MDKQILTKKGSTAELKVKGMIDTAVSAISGTNQVDLEALKADQKSLESLTSASNEQYDRLFRMYSNAKTDEERADIRRMMEKLTDQNFETHEKSREYRKHTQDDNKQHGLLIFCGLAASLGVCKFQKPLKEMATTVVKKLSA